MKILPIGQAKKKSTPLGVDFLLLVKKRLAEFRPQGRNKIQFWIYNLSATKNKR